MDLTNLARFLDGALRAAGVPIIGVAIGVETDRATWRIEFDPAATPGQRADGATLLQTITIDAAALAAQDQKDAQLHVDSFSILQKAIVLALIDQLNVIRAALPTPLSAITPAQALAAIRAKAGML
jgi:hypothetical protein